MKGSSMHVRDLPIPPRRLPLIGDLLRIDAAAPIQSELGLLQTIGPLFQLNLGGRGKDIIVTTDHRAIESVSNEESWAKFLAAPFMVMRDSMTGKGLITARTADPMWESAHSLLTPGFTKSALREYHPLMVGAVDELCHLWESSTGAWVDVARDMNRLTLEVIARSGFSDSFSALDGCTADGLAEHLTAALRLVSSTAHSLPGIRALRQRRLVSAATMLRSTATNVVASHRSPPDRTDLLDRMNAGQPGTGLPISNAAEQCLTFLVAGNETTAGSLSFALHFISLDEKLQERMRAEVRSFASSGVLGYDDVAKLKLTRRVVDETMRLWPVAPAFFRRARYDTEIESCTFGTIKAPKNTVVMAHLVGAQRDPSTWGADAGEFRPDRFVTAELRRHPDRVFRPFGVGPRSCIGRQFALHEAVLALASIVARFRVIPDPEYALEVEEMITLKPRGLRIKVEPVLVD